MLKKILNNVEFSVLFYLLKRKKIFKKIPCNNQNVAKCGFYFLMCTGYYK